MGALRWSASPDWKTMERGRADWLAQDQNRELLRERPTTGSNSTSRGNRIHDPLCFKLETAGRCGIGFDTSREPLEGA